LTNFIQQKNARIDLAVAYRTASRLGMAEGICNHFTMAVPGEEDRFYLIPYGLHWSEVCASDFVVVNSKGNKISGDGYVEPTAFHIHGAIHESRPDAVCVMHTHMKYALTVAMIEGGRLLMSDQNACRFFGRISYMNSYSGIVLDRKGGIEISNALGNADILFLSNHGVIVVGSDIAQAWEDLYYLEQACAAQVSAMSTGQKLSIIDDQTAAKVSRQIIEESESESSNKDRHFEALKRILIREEGSSFMF